ncbi:MAG: hypothetical protein R3C17_02380 [Planctomycetaceae bacterium]
MSTALKRISVQDYLQRERQATFKSEFFQGEFFQGEIFQGEIFARAGGSASRSLIAANFVRESGNALKDKPCAVFSSDLRVRVEPTGL